MPFPRAHAWMQTVLLPCRKSKHHQTLSGSHSETPTENAEKCFEIVESCQDCVLPIGILMNRLPLSNRHVFIVGEDMLFDEGVANLLTTRTEMRVSRAKYTDNAWLVNSVLQNHPDTLLLAESDALGSTRLLDLIFSISLLENLRVVVVRLENTIVDVYEYPRQTGNHKVCRQWQFVITQGHELLDIVQGNFEQIPNQVFSQIPCGGSTTT